MSSENRRGLWRGVFWVAVIVFVVTLGALGVIIYGYWAGQNAYDRLGDVAFPEAEAQEDPLAIDWDALRAINPEVCGWIIVPGTVIDYPIVHRDGDDQHYLKYDFYGETYHGGPEYGCIMLSGANKADWSDQVNLCFGHNMANGAMFAAFNTLRDDESFNAHRTIYLLTPEHDWELETFAMDHVHMTDTAIAVQNFPTAQGLTDYVQARIDASIVTPSPAPPPASTIKKVFAFSTCDPDNRWRNITFASIKRELR